MTFGTSWVKSTLLGSSLAAMAIAAPTQGYAQDEIDAVNTGNVAFGLSVDAATGYWFRGISQGGDNVGHLVIQPGADVSFALFSDGDFSVDYYLGTWNSFTTETDDFGDSWYESDLYTGFAIGLPGGFSADVAYILLYGPSGGGEFAQEIDLGIGYDDSAIWADAGVEYAGFAGLQPYALLVFETSGGSDGGDEGIYLELGVEPTFALVEAEDYPVTLSLPVAVGLSIDDYYQHTDDAGNRDDAFFGFVSVGVNFSVPLSFIPAEYGAWEAGAGVTFLFLGDGLEDFSDNDAGTGDQSVRYIGTFSLSMSY